MHILLIEPDRMLAETYRQSLLTAGHTVTPCASAQAAIIAADQQRPDVVVLELQLIEHSGIEFLYEFRSYTDWHAIPIIVQSQVPIHEFSGNWQLLQKQLGVNQYLYKSHTTLKQLCATVEKYIPTPVVV